MILIAIVALVVSLKLYYRHRSLRFFSYYIGLSLIQSGADFYRHLAPKHDPFAYELIVIADIVFIVFEFSLCTFFILRYITGKARRWAVKLNATTFFIFLVLFLVHKLPIIVFSKLWLVESVALVPPCLIYFYELFLTVNSRSLKEQPSFWIVTGVLFLNSCSIPLLVSLEYLGSLEGTLFGLNDILYSILFVLIIRAFRCRPEEAAPVFPLKTKANL